MTLIVDVNTRSTRTALHFNAFQVCLLAFGAHVHVRVARAQLNASAFQCRMGTLPSDYAHVANKAAYDSKLTIRLLMVRLVQVSHGRYLHERELARPVPHQTYELFRGTPRHDGCWHYVLCTVLKRGTRRDEEGIW